MPAASMKDWLDPTKTLNDLLEPEALKVISPKGKLIKGVDLPRLTYWGRVGQGDPNPNEDPILGSWSLRDAKQLHDALAVHIKVKGGQDWQYLGVVYGGGACWPCCAVVSLPRKA